MLRSALAILGVHLQISVSFVYFAFTAAGGVQCGGRKTSPLTSIIVQFRFHFWSFEISERFVRNQKLNWFRLIFTDED